MSQLDADQQYKHERSRNTISLDALLKRMDEITIVEYNPHWPILFAQEAARIHKALGELVAEIEHIRSTAQPGLAAKPVIDLAVGVTLSKAKGAVPLSQHWQKPPDLQARENAEVPRSSTQERLQ